MSSITAKLREECDYDPEGENTIDALIEYKNTLEHIVERVDALMQGEGEVNGGDLVEALSEMGFGQVDDPAPYGEEGDILAAEILRPKPYLPDAIGHAESMARLWQAARKQGSL